MSQGTRYALAARRDPAAWTVQVETEGNGLEFRNALSRAEEAEEMLLMGLRLEEGLRLDRLAAFTGHKIAPQALALYQENGLLALSPDQRALKATPAGRLVLNSLIAELAEALEPAAINTAPA